MYKTGELIYAAWSQDNITHAWGVSDNWKEGLLGTGNTLFLDLVAGYMGVFNLWKFSELGYLEIFAVFSLLPFNKEGGFLIRRKEKKAYPLE